MKKWKDLLTQVSIQKPYYNGKIKLRKKRLQDLHDKCLKEAERFINALVKTKGNQAEIDKLKKYI